MLDALLTHQSLPAWADVDFEFLFIECDGPRVEHLRSEIAQLGALPANVLARVEHGEFEGRFDALVAPIIQAGVPTFAFIDPFGYSKSPMSITGRLLDFPRCEVLYFLPMSFIHRFVGRPGQEAALNSLFGTEAWKGAVDLHGDQRTDFLLTLFMRQLAEKSGVQFVRSFQLRTADGQDFRLVFSVGHTKGLELAKDAMWKVDPIAGMSYRGETRSGQDVLFDSAATLDTRPLLQELRSQFGTRQFSIDDADRVTLVDTPFRKAHLREKTLAPAEKAGVLEVQRTGPRGFKNAKLRFKP